MGGQLWNALMSESKDPVIYLAELVYFRMNMELEFG
jgi:hypothetical protein